MKAQQIKDFEAGDYMSLATRKKSGEWVATPVWFAPLAGSYYVFSAGHAGKVKRLRNFSDARIARCTVTGRITGETFEADAFVLEGKDEATALKALHLKYGLKMKITDIFSALSGKKQQRAYIRVDPR
ncbi:PPOX class F420-dependent oxidoreductase [Seongchinamella unica]|uniref:PPOX class F420-dependent oxidoreductase n=1 Tax=Seongchinamella unica TaxID=2547392 RepID=A0A4R5LQV4_9GAMM|nr:PPOX class F420-dependent oxidoreductase [Seongchinamella unica]TDG12930.1 PPOX class F420-dependent oxidoreductase [Seongchinamella unica]